MDGDEDAADAGGGMMMIPSQASSHFPIEPVSADVLLRRETKRRDALKKRGPVRVGCREVDEYVLMGGGLERGSVVGVSAESEQMGLMISLQAVATELCGSEGEMSRAMVVTAQPPAAILPALRDAVKAELAARGVTGSEVRGRLVSCLERVSITRVFDLEGLWEVLGDLDIPPGSPGSEAASLVPQPQEEEVASPEPERIVLPDLKPAYESPQRRPVRTEIADSEEDSISDGEDGDVGDGKDNDINEDKDDEAPAPSSSELSDLSPPPSSMASMLATPDAAVVPEDQEESDSHDDPDAKQEEKPSTPPEQPAEDQNRRSRSPRMEAESPALPDIILITHFSTLMTALFTGRDRLSAHDGLQSLSAFLRYLSRSLSSSPLIMLLNSTSSSKSKTLTEPPPIPPTEAPPPDERSSSSSSKPLAATLRSVFNPPQLDIPGYAGHAAARRNKPTFGLVFAQLLDLHLLCTKVPRTREDAERLYAPHDRGDSGGGGGGMRYTWVVEVLLDELGVWEEGAAPGGRMCREQRWTAVDVRAGRVVDAFEGAEGRPKNVGDVRVVGGFGGPRVNGNDDDIPDNGGEHADMRIAGTLVPLAAAASAVTLPGASPAAEAATSASTRTAVLDVEGAVSSFGRILGAATRRLTWSGTSSTNDVEAGAQIYRYESVLEKDLAKSVYQIIQESGHERFAALLHGQEALRSRLAGTEGAFTVFVPTDEALQKLDMDQSGEALVREMAEYHVLEGVYSVDDLRGMQTAPTVLEERGTGRRQRLRLGGGGEDVVLNFYSRLLGDESKRAGNGIVHFVDDVLVPPPRFDRLVDVLPERLGVFSRALKETGVGEETGVKGRRGVTVFAPSDEAWDKIGDEVKSFLFGERGAGYLRALVRYHIIVGEILYTDVKVDHVEGTESWPGRYETLLGAGVSVRVHGMEGRRVMEVDGKKVSVRDLPARDGVVHVLDEVLIPSTTADGVEKSGMLDVEELKRRLDTWVKTSGRFESVEL
ncbi:fasciclin domain family [Colletotrichum asianum]|uniref:Fasciclin domain family n=1 Tax=Colletotrichum asianum TaxID=702518 RepID=A0A8H3ZJI4_9PEZI|nr:fasciclin domain family [Colletotrichum asianum]